MFRVGSTQTLQKSREAVLRLATRTASLTREIHEVVADRGVAIDGTLPSHLERLLACVALSCMGAVNSSIGIQVVDQNRVLCYPGGRSQR